MDTLKNSAGKIKQGMEHTTMYYLQKVLKHAKPEHIVYVYKHLQYKNMHEIDEHQTQGQLPLRRERNENWEK